MNREVHVRICESVGGKFPCATRLVSHTAPLQRSFDYSYKAAILQVISIDFPPSEAFNNLVLLKEEGE